MLNGWKLYLRKSLRKICGEEISYLIWLEPGQSVILIDRFKFHNFYSIIQVDYWFCSKKTSLISREFCFVIMSIEQSPFQSSLLPIGLPLENGFVNRNARAWFSKGTINSSNKIHGENITTLSGWKFANS